MSNLKSKKLKTILFNLLLIFMIVLGVVFPIVSIIALILVTLYFLLSNDDKKIIEICVFLAPFASIFKYNVGTTSFFTIIMLVFVFKMILKYGISKLFILFYLIFTLFCIIGVTNDVTSVIKMLIIPLFIYYLFVNKEKIDKDRVFKLFIYSIIIASFIGYFKDIIPNMNLYLIDKSLRIDVGVYTTRFSGLNGDPNYYSINVLLAMSLLFYLITRKSINLILGIINVSILLFFGAQTNSKSFILVLIGLILFALYSLIKNKRYILSLLVVFAVAFSIVMINNSKITIFDNLINRFSKDTNIDQLTTGRSEIQKMYIDYIGSNPKVLFFGNGFNSNLLNGHEAHNTYLQMIYNFGIFGTIIFIYLLLFGFKIFKIEKNFVNYLPLIVVLASYLGLSVLKYFDFPIHIFIVLLAICGCKRKSKKNDKVRLNEV